MPPTKKRKVGSAGAAKPVNSSESAAAVSSKAPLTTTTTESPTTHAKDKKDLLYDRCIEAKSVHGLFTSAELLGLGVVDDIETLTPLCLDLVNCHKFAMYQIDGRVIYRTRPREDALR
jgi:hypothetical protein